MTIAMQIIQIVFQSVAILFMITFMLIGIWSFIIFLKFYKNHRLQNNLLSKINSSIKNLEVVTLKDTTSEYTTSSDTSSLYENTDKVIKMDKS